MVVVLIFIQSVCRWKLKKTDYIGNGNLSIGVLHDFNFDSLCSHKHKIISLHTYNLSQKYNKYEKKGKYLTGKCFSQASVCLYLSSGNLFIFPLRVSSFFSYFLCYLYFGFGPKRDENGERRRLNNEELHSLYRSSNIVRVIKSRRLRWVGHVAR